MSNGGYPTIPAAGTLIANKLSCKELLENGGPLGVGISDFLRPKELEVAAEYRGAHTAAVAVGLITIEAQANGLQTKLMSTR